MFSGFHVQVKKVKSLPACLSVFKTQTLQLNLFRKRICCGYVGFVACMSLMLMMMTMMLMMIINSCTNTASCFLPEKILGKLLINDDREGSIDFIHS